MKILEETYFANDGAKKGFIAEYFSHEITHWITENVTGDWEIYGMPESPERSQETGVDFAFGVVFFDETDAMAFKLAWC